MRKYTIIALITLAHYISSWGVLFFAFGTSMGRLDDGTSPSGAEQILNGLSDILLYPLFIPTLKLEGGWLGGWDHVLLLVNSLLWGFGIYWLIWRFRHYQRVATE